MLQSTLSKTDAVGTCPDYPSGSGLCLMSIPSFKVLLTKKNTSQVSVKTVSKCLLSILDRCPSYREFSSSIMTEQRQRPTPSVCLTEMSIL